MAGPLVQVFTCSAGVAGGPNCDQVAGLGISQEYAANLGPGVVLEYATFATGGCTGGTTSGPSFMLVQLLPAGACISVAAQDGSPAVWAPASSYTFGSGAAFTPPFDVSQLDSAAIGSAFAAGFLLIATAMLLGMPIRMILGMIKR